MPLQLSSALTWQDQGAAVDAWGADMRLIEAAVAEGLARDAGSRRLKPGALRELVSKFNILHNLHDRAPRCCCVR